MRLKKFYTILTWFSFLLASSLIVIPMYLFQWGIMDGNEVSVCFLGGIIFLFFGLCISAEEGVFKR